MWSTGEQSKAGHTLTIEKIVLKENGVRVGYIIRSYQVKTANITDPELPLNWEGAYELFKALCKE